MVSIRRTLSPVTRPGTSVNGEACSVASPLSKSSSCNQNYTPSGGLSSSFSSLNYAFYKVQAFLLGLFTQRSSWPPEKTKVKGQIWRRVIFQFLVCFIVGFFVGLAPWVSMNLLKNLITKLHAFSFDVFPPVPINETAVADAQLETDNVRLESHTIHGETGNRTYNDTVLPQLFDQDSYTVFHKLLIIVTPNICSSISSILSKSFGANIEIGSTSFVVDSCRDELSINSQHIEENWCYVQAYCMQYEFNYKESELEPKKRGIIPHREASA